MKRKLLLVGGTLLLALSIDRASAQNSVGIGTKDPNPNAVLELVSPNHNQGLLVPRMTTAQRMATSFVGSLGASDRGLMVFDSEENSFYFWNGSGWALMDSPEIPQDLALNGTTLTITNNDNATAISLAPFLGTNTDEQTLSLAGTTLGISNGNNVDLSVLQDGFEPNTDNQTLNFVGTSLSISGGNSVNLASLDTDTDNQTLNLAGNVLSISGGNNVNLSSVNSDNQTLNLAAGTLSISGGNSVNLNSIDTDDQTLNLVGSNLSIAGGNTVNLSSIDTDTDDQTLNLVGSNLSISEGNTIDISSIDTKLTEAEVDAFVANNGFLTAEVDGSITNEIQDLNLAGNILTITNNPMATPIDLSPFSGTNTDNQTLSLAGGNLSITGGNTIDISSIDTDTDTDDQTLSLAGSTLSIADGNSVNLSSINTDNQNLNLVGSNLSISGGNTIDISSVDTNLTEAEVDAFVSNNGFLTAEVDGSITNEIQDLSLVGNILSITNNALATPIDLSPFSGTNTDNQTLSLAGGNLSITGGNTIDISSIDTDTDTDDQTLSLAGSTLSIADGNSVNLSSINTDNQTLSYGSGIIAISGGNNVNISAVNTDNQNLNLVGSNLSISGGNTIDISSVDTNLTEAEVDAFVSNNGFLTAEVDGSITNEIQDISTTGAAGNISIAGGSTLTLNVNDADASATNEIQDLTFNAGVIALSNDPGNTTIDLSGYDNNALDDFDGDFGSLLNIPAGIADGDDVGITSVNSNATLNGNGAGTPLGVNVGTGANQIVQLNAAAQLPAVDGSLLTNLPGITTVNSNTTLNGNGAGIPLGVNVGTGANQIVQLNAASQLPAVDGSLLTNLPGITSVNTNTTLTGNGAGTPLGVNVGTGANQIVQLNASGQLPAVNGSLLTGLPTSPWTGSPNISYSG
ncbi:MAG TPA: hypothetical protein PKJ63_10735, partial [Cyclobacteriaceae bacterium]|nr:hypothetical protein [Cyclobacteriaceae bacterium]